MFKREVEIVHQDVGLKVSALVNVRSVLHTETEGDGGVGRGLD